jgi:hypothetical protein
MILLTRLFRPLPLCRFSLVHVLRFRCFKQHPHGSIHAGRFGVAATSAIVDRAKTGSTLSPWVTASAMARERYLQRPASVGFSLYLSWQFEQAVVIVSAASTILSISFDCAAVYAFLPASLSP